MNEVPSDPNDSVVGESPEQSATKHNAGLDLHWRWEPTAEESMLTDRSDTPVDEWLANPQWPQFRGPGGVSQQNGPAIVTHW